jgi:hypothetical protein
MAIAGVDSRVPASRWLDIAYAIVADAPHAYLKAMSEQLVIASAKLRPDRDTWGLLPEHQAMARTLPEGAALRQARGR